MCFSPSYRYQALGEGAWQEETGFRGRGAGDNCDKRSCWRVAAPKASDFQFLIHCLLRTRLTILALKSNFELSKDICTAQANELSVHWNDTIQKQRAGIVISLWSYPSLLSALSPRRASSSETPTPHTLPHPPPPAQNKCH